MNEWLSPRIGERAVRNRRMESDSQLATTGRSRCRTAAWVASELLYRAASIANAADSTDTTAKNIILELCQTGHWTVGRAFLRINGESAEGPWLVICAGTGVLPPGWQAGEQLLAAGPMRPALARIAWEENRGVAASIDFLEGLSSGVAVPVRHLGRVQGAIELYGPGAVPQEPGLLDTLLEIGEQLAHVLMRQRRHREALRQQQELLHIGRLASMRELARNLAHEVNQPLAAVVSYAGGALQLLAQGRAEPDKLKRALEQVGVQAKRASNIIQEFREFLRRGDTRHERLDLRKLINETAMLMASVVREAGANLVVRLPPELPEIEGDPIQLQQVLINLIHNAVESLSGAPASRRRLLEIEVEVDEQVEIRVRDTGVGMPGELLPQLFTPFLTTKPHGLGMGLPVSRSIVEFHGGRMSADNNPDGGMTFRVRLPPARSLSSSGR